MYGSHAHHHPDFAAGLCALHRVPVPAVVHTFVLPPFLPLACTQVPVVPWGFACFGSLCACVTLFLHLLYCAINVVDCFCFFSTSSFFVTVHNINHKIFHNQISNSKWIKTIQTNCYHSYFPLNIFTNIDWSYILSSNTYLISYLIQIF